MSFQVLVKPSEQRDAERGFSHEASVRGHMRGESDKWTNFTGLGRSAESAAGQALYRLHQLTDDFTLPRRLVDQADEYIGHEAMTEDICGVAVRTQKS